MGKKEDKGSVVAFACLVVGAVLYYGAKAWLDSDENRALPDPKKKKKKSSGKGSRTSKKGS